MANASTDNRFKRTRGTFETRNAVYKDKLDGTLSPKLSSVDQLEQWKMDRLTATGGAQQELPLTYGPVEDVPSSVESSSTVLVAIGTGDFPISGRDLHAALGVDTQFGMWISRRLTDADAVRDMDFEERCGESGRREFVLTIDMAKHIAMMERSDAGKRVRRYFIECEKSLLSGPSFSDPLTAAKLYVESETARRWAEAKLLTTEKEAEALGDRVELLTAKIEAPKTCVTLTQFAKDTESLLGMTPPVLFQYLRDTDVLGRAPASKWDSHNVVLAPWNGCGYFQYVRHRFDRPARNAVGDVESMASVTKTTPLLTKDQFRDGIRTRMGGYSWLLAKIQKDPRAALYRLVARDGGREGRWAPLYGARLFPARGYDALICETDGGVITFWKNPDKQATGDRFVVCRYTEAPGQHGFLKAAGATLEAALEALLEATPEGSRKPLSKVNLFDE